MRKYHLLTPGKNQERPRYIVYFDSESRVRKDGRHVPYLVVATFKNYRYGSQTQKVYPTRTYHEFWKDAASYGDKHHTTYIIAHNVGYDVLVTGGITELTNLGFRVTSWFEKGSTYLLYLRHDKTEKKLIILSSTNYFAQSLEKLGQTLGIPKLSIDYNRASLAASLEYCKQDVLILQTAVETFINFVDRENLGNFGKTVPGQAFNAFKHRFMTHEIWIHNNETAIELERGAYYGGRTECFQLGELPRDDYYYYDVNSMYPAVMLANKYPVRLLTTRKRMSNQEAARHLTEGKGLCADCLVSTQEPLFPVRVNDNLIFPVGTFRTWLTTPEIKYAIEHNQLVQIFGISLYQMDDIFSSYVDYFYNQRLAANASGNKVLDLLYKLFMNSLYGKFGQKSDTWLRVGDAPIDLIQLIKVVDGETGEATTHKIFGGSEFKQIDEEESYNSFPAIAAHVTGYSRMLLASYFQAVGWENVYYCDTDSLFTNKTGHQRLTQYIDPTRLGSLKLEKESQEVKILCPKDYQFGKDVKTKGVRKDSKKVNDNTWETTVWPKLASFINTGKLTGYRNLKRLKTLRRIYTKGWVLPGGRVLPLTLAYVDGANHVQDYQGETLTDRKEMVKKYRGFYNG